MPNINHCRCILVIGGTSGLGRKLALSILNLGPWLDELAASYGPSGRLKTMRLDITSDPSTLRSAVSSIVRAYPDLDAVMFSSGTQQYFDLTRPETINLDHLSNELTTNYTSVVNLIVLFLPQLIRIGSSGRPAFLYLVSAGMAVIPWVPNFSASKAALHNLSMALAVQLRRKNVHVVEIMPPLVESEMYARLPHRDQLATFWMPLDECTKQTMAGLVAGAPQIPIGMMAPVHQKYVAGKLEAASKMLQNHEETRRGNVVNPNTVFPSRGQ
ncbi:NAD(P)-binding protein [Scleroderma citrinum]